MADKTNFTPDEWKLILESVMMAGMAVSAAEPSGLFGLLKEGFAEGNALAQAKMDPHSNALVKAVVADFGTSAGRGAARDDLKQKISGSKPPEIKAMCIGTLRQAAAVLDAKAPGTRRHSRVGSARSANMSPRRPPRAAFSVSVVLRSVKRKRRHSRKSRVR